VGEGRRCMRCGKSIPREEYDWNKGGCDSCSDDYEAARARGETLAPPDTPTAPPPPAAPPQSTDPPRSDPS